MTRAIIRGRKGVESAVDAGLLSFCALFLGTVLVGALCACGPSSAGVAALPITTPAKPPVVIGPLPLPLETMVVGRWVNPQQWLDRVQSWTDGILPWGGVLRTGLVQPEFPIDLSAPIEWLVTVDRSLQRPVGWALSMALTFPAGAEFSESEVASPVGLSCRQVSSLGAWPARVVCSPSTEILLRHLPAMTRSVPFTRISDANLSLKFAQPSDSERNQDLARGWLHGWLATNLGVETRNEKIGAQLDDFAADLDNELRALLTDFNEAVLSLTPSEAGASLDASLRVPFRAPSSHWLKSRVGNAAAGLAPREFWQFPVDAQQAGFHWSVQWQHLNAQREPLARLLGSILEFRGLPKRLEIQARQLIEILPFPQGPIAWAQGGAETPTSNSTQSDSSWPESLGWNIQTFGGGLAEVRYFVRQLVRTFKDPVVGAQLGRLFRAGVGRNRAPKSITLRNVRGGLPAGSFRVDVQFTPSEHTPQARPQLSFLFAPASDEGFAVAWGANAEQLRRLLRPVAKGNWSRTLAGRAGLGELNNVRVLRGGFASVYSLQQEGNFRLLEHVLPLRSVALAPHRGATPVLSDWRLVHQEPNDDASLLIRAALAPTVIADLLFVLGID